MEILNATRMQAGYTLGLKPDGRESLVVAIKGTYTIPENGEKPRLAEEQVPLVEADEFTGEPGFSATLYETDYAPHKPRCDVLLNGSAYAPAGKPAVKVPVSLQIDPISKSFYVVGYRVWLRGIIGFNVSKPKPFTVMPISYDSAYGGVDNTHENPKKHKAYLTNLVGVGYHENIEPKFVEGTPVPNTEEISNPVTKTKGKYKPMAFGPIGRVWQPRAPLAGTYDQNWIDNIFPFLPPDFNDAYFQSAPPDQQMPYPRGGEKIVLQNLTPEGRTIFTLPDTTMPVTFYLKNYDEQETQAVVDTIVIEPDKNRFMLTWRTALPLRRNIFEVVQVVTGRMSKGWYRARRLGKTYNPLLNKD